MNVNVLRGGILVLSAVFKFLVFLLKVVKSTTHHSLRGILLYHWSDGLVVFDLLLSLHRFFDSAEFVFDAMLKDKKLFLELLKIVKRFIVNICNLRCLDYLR